ncbi:MAG: thioredoxin-disulfide reductase [Chloroflexi bacterium]|nr:thioredoxin-disulfide reductase [Chloroflexota bacterium]
MPEVYDIVIIGGGPAGLAAALYASRARHSTVVLEKATPGGQLCFADRVEDYPGFPEGIGGAALAEAMHQQAMRFDGETVYTEATGIGLDGHLKIVHTAEGDFRARAVIIATGGEPNRLGVPGERELDGRGVSCCGQCSAVFYEGKPVVVVGGGDAALSDALFLAKYASKVTLVHRRDQLRAMEILQEEARANPRIEFIWNTVVEEVLGEEVVTGVRVRNTVTGEASTLEVEGVFVHVGYHPNTALFQGLLPLQASGHIPTDEWMETLLPGVFVAGDVRAEAARQAITAAGDGATAAIRADHYLSGAE